MGYIGSNSAATAVTAEHTFKNLTYSLGYKWVYDRDASFTETSFLPDMIKMKNSGVKMVLELTQQGAVHLHHGPGDQAGGSQRCCSSPAPTPTRRSSTPGRPATGTLVDHRHRALHGRGRQGRCRPWPPSTSGRRRSTRRPQLDLYTLYGWINAELFVQALKGAGANPTRASLDAQLNKVTSFNASGLISNQDPAQKIPGQCWIAAQYNNGTWQRIAPDPKAGFVCNPGGFYPTQLQGHLPLSRHRLTSRRRSMGNDS